MASAKSRYKIRLQSTLDFRTLSFIKIDEKYMKWQNQIVDAIKSENMKIKELLQKVLKVR